MKVALVHDDFVQAGGAESLFATIAAVFKDAPIYTSVVNWHKLPESIDRTRINISFIQKIPYAKNFFKALLPLYPFAFESFNFGEYDLVISSTTRFAKSIITKPNTLHISYVNSVPRFLYSDQAASDYLPQIARFFISPWMRWLRRWDKVSSARVDYYIANSDNVARQINLTYHRSSQVIFPFADTNFYTPPKVHKWQLKSQNYYLIVSRLVKWKKISIALEACGAIGAKLIIVGDGPDKAKLMSLAANLKSEIDFLGRVTREDLRDLYRNCKALIVTQEEDFGISSVEAQSCGKPVIAYHIGGQAGIIKDGQTGLLFKNQTKESLQDAIARLGSLKWSTQAIRGNSLRFTRNKFISALKNKIHEYAGNS